MHWLTRGLQSSERGGRVNFELNLVNGRFRVPIYPQNKPKILYDILEESSVNLWTIKTILAWYDICYVCYVMEEYFLDAMNWKLFPSLM